MPLSTDICSIINNDPEWSEPEEIIITEPFNYLNKNKGKQLRTKLIQSFNKILNIDPKALAKIATIIELLHTASLLIDDIEDNSNLRRGKPTAHLIYGVPFTINSSNYIYFKSFQELIQLSELCPTDDKRSQCIKVFNDELLNLHRGQCMDLHWRDNLIIPTEKQYLTMVMNKTGGLFRLAIRLMELFQEPQVKSLVPLVNLLGMIYQIRDDYLNLKSDQLQKNKGYCEDITEGKFSFPVVHALSVSQGDKTLVNILKQRTKDQQVMKFAVDYLSDQGSFRYTTEVLNQLKNTAIDIINELGDFEELVIIVNQLANV